MQTLRPVILALAIGTVSWPSNCWIIGYKWLFNNFMMGYIYIYTTFRQNNIYMYIHIVSFAEQYIYIYQ